MCRSNSQLGSGLLRYDHLNPPRERHGKDGADAAAQIDARLWFEHAIQALGIELF